jgi:hypothetical protein
MKIHNAAIAALTLLLSQPIVTDHSFAASGPARSLPMNGADEDWATTLVQENEGIPNPNSPANCSLVSRPVIVACPRGVIQFQC